MNTTALSHHYECLTPWERLPLMVAASLRGDELEADRLARKAPTSTFRVPNYRGLSEGLHQLVFLYLIGRTRCPQGWHRRADRVPAARRSRVPAPVAAAPPGVDRAHGRDVDRRQRKLGQDAGRPAAGRCRGGRCAAGLPAMFWRWASSFAIVRMWRSAWPPWKRG
jgi:hypothetical protein